MHNANDNQPLSTDSIIELRPSPEELNRILHRRFPGMGPAYGRQLDEAARATFNADMTQWLGLDNRWHSTAEKYRQAKGSRRQAKERKPVPPAVLSDEQDVGARYRRYAATVADGAEFLAGRSVPAVGGRLLQIGEVEDALITLIDTVEDTWAEIPAERARRGRPRKVPAAANDNQLPVRRAA
ncbi:hypothetical protein J2R96_008166 [Bradyrhizobium elkanii]|nr:hypothetical protein [Bradyrhizobium elkanii]